MAFFRDLLLVALAIWAAIASLLYLQQKQHILRLSVESLTDALTGLLNRRGLEDRFYSLVSHAVRSGETLAVFLLDANRFKKVNDLHGHKVGDAVLVALAQAMRGTFLRGGDVIARHGGDEFVVILSMLRSEEDAAVPIRRLFDRVRGVVIQSPRGEVTFTVSAGGALLRREGDVVRVMDETWSLPDVRGSALIRRIADYLLDKADKSMYAAKEVANKQDVSVVAVDGQVVHSLTCS